MTSPVLKIWLHLTLAMLIACSAMVVLNIANQAHGEERTVELVELDACEALLERRTSKRRRGLTTGNWSKSSATSSSLCKSNRSGNAIATERSRHNGIGTYLRT